MGTAPLSELQISVVSDAPWSLFGGRRVPILGQARRLAEHDLSIVKPALLYGDKVTLLSGNPFIAAQVESFAAETTMPPRALGMFLRLHDFPEEILDLAEVDRSSLPSREDLLEFDERYSDTTEWLTEGYRRWSDAIFDTVGKVGVAVRKSLEDYTSQELREVEAAGLLTIQGHTDTPAMASLVFGPARLMRENPAEYQERALEAVIQRLTSSGDTLVVDRFGEEVLTHLDLPQRRQDPGLQLLSSLPSLRATPVQRILELRDELGAPLVRYRAAMRKAEREMQAESSATADGLVEGLWHEVLAPALVDLKEAADENTYSRHLFQQVQDPTGLVPGVAGVALAVGGQGSIEAAIGGALGVAWPLLRAWYQRNADRRKIQGHRLYLVHRLSDPRP